MTNDRELNLDQLGAVSGGTISGWAHAIVDSAISQARSTGYPMPITFGSGSGSGDGSGSGSGSGPSGCPSGCHGPA